MGTKRWMWMSVVLAAILGFMVPAPAWAAWGMREEPKGEAVAAGPSTGSGRTEPAAPAAPDFKGVEDLAKEDSSFAQDMLRLAAERYLNRNKPLQAVEIYKQALKLAPSDTQFMEGLASAQLAAGQKEEAMAVWEGVIAGHKDVGYQFQYAGFLEKAGEGAKAIEVVRAIAAQRPDDTSMHYWIADAYGRQGKPAEAVKELQAMLKAFPKEETEIKRRIALMQPAPVKVKPEAASEKSQ